MLKKFFYFLTTLLVVFGILAVATPAFASGGKKELKGTIAAVDTVGNTITITPQKGGANVVLNVNSSTFIKRNNATSTLSALQVGDKVEAKFDPATMIASSISVKFKSSELKGVIAAVDTTGNTVTITPQKGGANMVLSVNSGTAIRRNGASVTLADLQIGDKVEAKYNSSSMLASSINAEFESPEIMGTIAAVDTVGNTVTIKLKKGANVVVNVNSSTLIKRNGVAATLSALQVGDKVEAKYNSGIMLASFIDAESH